LIIYNNYSGMDKSYSLMLCDKHARLFSILIINVNSLFRAQQKGRKKKDAAKRAADDKKSQYVIFKPILNTGEIIYFL